jgi:CRP-like cAMP-binding protein
MLPGQSMQSTTAVPVINRVIENLSRRERKQVLENCEPVELVFGTVLCEPEKPIKYVYFPLNGFISQMATVNDHEPLEMGLIGNEGILGVTLILGIDRAPLLGIVQGSGNALRMPAARFKRLLKTCPGLSGKLNRYLYIMMAQLAQSAACTHFHNIESRLARWLLMTHDRAHSDYFYLTHEYLGQMLGVRRSGVTIAARELHRRKLINYVRGNIHIINRAKLEDVSCACYGTMMNDYARLLT